MRYGSVCSGIEAATMAWHGLGWEPAFFSDIEKFPVAVLQHHYPNVPVHGDFTTIKDDEYGTIDLLVGGTPCQSFSVAGLRGGLDDDRGNLALEFLRLAQRKTPKWLVWENVPGVLSSNGGRDFGSFLGALAEIGYGFAYRVLDAQYFGVAQRRRRVFVVGYLGDWRRAAAVLFERESLLGNPAPSREEGKKVAPAVTTGPPFSRTENERVECDAIVPMQLRVGVDPTNGAVTGEVAATMTTAVGSSNGTGPRVLECEAIVPMQTVGALDTQCGLAQQAHQSLNAGHYVLERDVMGTLTTRTFTALGARDVEEGAVIAFSAYNQSAESEDVSQTVASRNDQDTASCVAVGFQSTANACDAAAAGENVSPTLRRDPMAVAYPINDKATRHQGAAGRGSGNGLGIGKDGDPSPTLTTGDKHAVAHAVRESLSVRRLTPTECERLQGFPQTKMEVDICVNETVRELSPLLAARSAGKSSNTNQASPKNAVHAHVLINLEQGTVQLLNAEKLILSANNAETQKKSHLLTEIESSARSLAGMTSTLGKIIQAGKEESPLMLPPSITQQNGRMRVEISGRETEELAKDAVRSASEITKFIISRQGQTTQSCDLNARILSSSVYRAIAGFIPEITSAESSCITVSVIQGFTQIPYRNKPAENCPDGPRYKALGNSMAVPVMSWIGQRIQAVEAL